MKVILEGLNIIKKMASAPPHFDFFEYFTHFWTSSKSDWAGLMPMKYKCNYWKVKCIISYLFLNINIFSVTFYLQTKL